MKFFYIAFNGSYLGGEAVVQAGDEKHALETLCNDRRFKALPEVEQASLEVMYEVTTPVLYFSSGDY